MHSTGPVNERNELWRFTAELIRTALIVGVLTFLIRGFLIQPFVVKGESMSPRFHSNDYLLVDKLSGVLGIPQRGDIIVFKYPNNTAENYVKRVIGLPGDRVTIANGRVTVATADKPNGVVLDEPYLGPGITTTPIDGSPSANYVVPAKTFFVLGDNRPNSSDSRDWGFLPEEDLIGRVVVEAYPFNQAAIFRHIHYANLD